MNMPKKSEQFYVYVHCRPSGEPFYVGKGTLRRASNLGRRNRHHEFVVVKYGKENIQIFTLVCVNAEQAYRNEIWMIAWCKAQGHKLTNATDGGEGGFGNKNAAGNKNMLGKKHSDETKAKMSIAGKVRKCSAEQKERIRVGAKRRWSRSEERARASNWMKGKRNTLGLRYNFGNQNWKFRKISKGGAIGNKNAAGQIWTEERRAQHSRRMLGNTYNSRKN